MVPPDSAPTVPPDTAQLLPPGVTLPPGFTIPPGMTVREALAYFLKGQSQHGQPGGDTDSGKIHEAEINNGHGEEIVNCRADIKIRPLERNFFGPLLQVVRV